MLCARGIGGDAHVVPALGYRHSAHRGTIFIRFLDTEEHVHAPDFALKTLFGVPGGGGGEGSIQAHLDSIAMVRALPTLRYQTHVRRPSLKLDGQRQIVHVLRIKQRHFRKKRRTLPFEESHTQSVSVGAW